MVKKKIDTMKRWFLSVLLMLCLGNVQAMKTIELNWDFFHPVKKAWLPLGTHGSVQEALIATGEMPDPYYGTNEEKFAWFEEHLWEFKSILVLDSSHFENEYLELEFGNIDTYASIQINGKDWLTTANAFIPHRKQAKDFLKVGVNEITVIITPPVLFHQEMWDTASYHLPAPNDVHETAIAPYTRKPQYQFGWDWALRMNTIGFNKPARLYCYNHNRVVNKTVRVFNANEETAEVQFIIYLAVADSAEYELSSDYIEKTVVRAQSDQLKRVVTHNNPKLWWPKGQGEQYLYRNTINIKKLGTEEEITIPFTYGIKTAELVQENDEWGTSYYFKINGRKIFAKGGDYIPQDIFPARVSDASVRQMVEQMHAANFNMVRVWGGGYYPDEVFYETCDSLGIMVWQDLMFACAMYPGDDDFIENISQEFHYQVPRIAGHPSVVQFNGNNEVEVAWGNWGFQIKYGLYGKSAKEIEASYDRVFKKLAPSIIQEYTGLPYIHTSPLSNWGKKEYYNHGSQHYWGVWHGKDPIEDFGKKIGRFNAEYGFQSFPEYNTLRTFSDSNAWELNSTIMRHHQKSYVGNDMILKHAKRLYGTPADFETFVYYSQLTQAMAVSMAVAGHRVDFPRCGGTLYWQVNDCWQAPTWSSIDYFNNWKALHYRIRDDYKEIAVVESYEDLDTRNYFLVSGVADTFECQLEYRISSLKGKELERVSKTWVVEGMGKYRILSNIDLEQWNGKNIRIDFEWTDVHGVNHQRSFDRIQKSRKTPDCDDFSVEIVSLDEAAGECMVLVNTKEYLCDFWLYCDLPGVQFDRNFVSLPPGSHPFLLTSPKLHKDLKLEARYR
jgi:beta-mannosidase